ncbi:MAG: transcription antitermination factor NusB [Lachnospiraceae bacterium]|nr:transcription antitermination factor NusB [Lachnospiraceae bacterium]MBR3003786.1 transcription antitermination factor NusB [Lachnospiraceae bacterium]MBR6348928.1 transcription antitermination factor NusB [Lachnospiraceae bacterium]
MDKIDRRSELREAAFLILFRADFYPPEELASQVKDFFEGEEEFTEKERQQIADKVVAVAQMIPEIDRALDEISVGWKTRRMTKVDLTILRLAYYEIKYDDKVPVSSAINEAVELAKNYGTENSGSFVNGILAKVAKDESK